MQATSSHVIQTTPPTREDGFVPDMPDSEPDPFHTLTQAAISSKRTHLLVRRRKRSGRRAVR